MKKSGIFLMLPPVKALTKAARVMFLISVCSKACAESVVGSVVTVKH